MTEYKSVRFKSVKVKNEWFITPAIGIIDRRNYYGYPVFAIAFAWLKWRCKVEVGVKRWRCDGCKKRGIRKCEKCWEKEGADNGI